MFPRTGTLEILDTLVYIPTFSYNPVYTIAMIIIRIVIICDLSSLTWPGMTPNGVSGDSSLIFGILDLLSEACYIPQLGWK